MTAESTKPTLLKTWSRGHLDIDENGHSHTSVILCKGLTVGGFRDSIFNRPWPLRPHYSVFNRRHSVFHQTLR